MLAQLAPDQAAFLEARGTATARHAEITKTAREFDATPHQPFVGFHAGHTGCVRLAACAFATGRMASIGSSRSAMALRLHTIGRGSPSVRSQFPTSITTSEHHAWQ